MKKLLLFLSAVAILFPSCATNIVTMSVTEPAPVTIPAEVKSAGIVNRSLTSDENKGLDKMDQILSIEGFTLDSIGAEACIQGVYDELVQKKRFELTKILDTVQLRNPILGATPSRLDWTEVERICETNRIDVLYVLERYDTDSKIAYSTHPITIRTPIGLDVPGLEHQASVTTMIKTTWRIYDPITKLVYDEFSGSRRFISRGKGINPVVALKAVTNRNDLVKQNSNQVGHIYAKRAMSYWIRVSRDYYVGGSRNLSIGKRKAQTGNWDGAAELWLKDANSSKPSVAGKGCYNMAISNEINGNLDKAIEWAQKSYEDYNNKLALKYVKILRKRKAKIKQLKIQQGK